MIQFHQKQSDNTTSQRPTKRQSEDLKETTPTIIVNQAPTAKVTEESVNRNQNFLRASPVHNIDGLALKLNRFKEKCATYVSHKDFVSQYIKSKLVPKGLEMTLEATSENYDQYFNTINWYFNLQFSWSSWNKLFHFVTKQ